MNYDLEERTTKFGEDVIDLCKKIQATTITRPIISQLIRSATSIGANYMEADGASSPKDFRNKIFICKKEASETKYWLRILVKADDSSKEIARVLWNECQEFVFIFQKICQTLDGKKQRGVEGEGEN